MASSSKLSSSTTYYQYVLLILLVFFLSVPLFVSSSRVFPTNSRSLKSPFHVPTKSSSKSLRFNLKLMHRHRPVRYSLDDVHASAVINEPSTVLFVNVSIGEPPVPQLLVMDTGSELLWVQCRPCKNGFDQITPLFEPDESSTFLNIPCNTNLCHKKCAHPNSDMCPYSFTYGDGTNSSGTLGTDQLTLRDNEGTTISVEHDVIMGCGRKNFSPTSSGESGILGLDAGSYSLASQRGRKFSYCIGNLSDHSYAYNQLIIGESAVMQGDTTPLEVYNNFYYVTIAGIAIDAHTLDIDPNVFKRQSRGGGGMIFDSGSTYSYLPRPAFEAIVNRVEELVNGRWNRVPFAQDDERICYYGSIWPDTIGFPTLNFLLDGGAKLESDRYSMFDQASPRAFCLAFLPAEQNEPGIVGLMAQQGYNVGHDPDGKKLYLTHSDCQYLEDSSSS